MHGDSTSRGMVEAYRIRRLYEAWGSHPYDEDLAQVEHAVQCAELARTSGADDSLVVACLLHDIGHLLELERTAGSPIRGVDDDHEAAGASFLARVFGPQVTAPIALHVAAKRYLCTVEPAYHDSLSPASAKSLILQGGRMSGVELARFEANPSAIRAVALRRWDEMAKSSVGSGLSFDDFADVFTRVLGPERPV